MIPDKPIPSEHIIKYFSCGLDVNCGHFHVTEKAALKCIKKQKRKRINEITDQVFNVLWENKGTVIACIDKHGTLSFREEQFLAVSETE